jgi:cytosine/adenosine deaminase-related metal-dependent hydrolase
MSLRIDGGTIVGWSGEHHELIPDGSVLIDGDSIKSVGRERPAADRVIDASGKLVSPGFVNLHVHSQINVGDYLLTDATRGDYMFANYFVFAGLSKERMPALPKEAVAMGRAYSQLSALRNGSTTILDPGGPPGDLDDYVAIVGRIGGRVFTSPAFRSRDTFADAAGRFSYEDRADRGRPGLQTAVDFIRKHDNAHGRLHAFLLPSQAETVEPSLFKEAMAAARELGVGVHTHAGGNLREFVDLLYNHRKSPIEYLADCGALGPRTVLGHAVFIGGHSRVPYRGDDLKLLAETGTSVGHCPYKYAKFGAALESFDRYRERGINLGLGTDTYPFDIIAEMRWAAMLSRIVEGSQLAGRAADVFNAATIGGARALGRDDLGRLAPGAKADLVIINQRDVRHGLVRDPINALVDAGTGADVETVLVGGEVVIDKGASTRVDGEAMYRDAERLARGAWDNWARRDFAGRTVEQIVPPAFPTRG